MTGHTQPVTLNRLPLLKYLHTFPTPQADNQRLSDVAKDLLGRLSQFEFPNIIEHVSI